MKLKPLVLVLATLPLGSAFGAALERSPQSVSAFLQSGNYLEYSYTWLSPDVKGMDASGNPVPGMARGYGVGSFGAKLQANPQVSVGLLVDEPFGASAAYEAAPDRNNNFVAAPGGSLVIRPATATTPAVAVPYATLGITGSTNVEVNSRNITSLVGYKPIPAVTVYGGLAFQSIEGQVQARGAAYGQLNGYSLQLKSDNGIGFVAGAAYEIPKIALKTSLTYRSKVEQRLQTEETLPAIGAVNQITGQLDQVLAGYNALDQINAGLNQINTGLANQGLTLQQAQAQVAALNQIPAQQRTAQQSAALDQLNSVLTTQQRLAAQQAAVSSRLAGAPSREVATASRAQLAPIAAIPGQVNGSTKIDTPQSVNFEFQSGILPETLLFGNVRWVEWSNFTIQPPLYGQVTSLAVPGGYSIVKYKEDQWSGNIGVARRLTPKLVTSLSFGYDSGAGENVTPLGPTNGFKNVGIGVRYSPDEHVELSAGYRYLWLGDANAVAPSGTQLGRFEDNTASVFGVKVGYRF